MVGGITPVQPALPFEQMVKASPAVSRERLAVGFDALYFGMFASTAQLEGFTIFGRVFSQVFKTALSFPTETRLTKLLLFQAAERSVVVVASNPGGRLES